MLAVSGAALVLVLLLCIHVIVLSTGTFIKSEKEIHDLTDADDGEAETLKVM